MPPKSFETSLNPIKSVKGYGAYFLMTTGALIFCLGLVGFHFGLLFFSAVLIITGLILRTEPSEFELDLPGRRYRRFTNVFGVKSGEWQPLPPITGVVVKYFSEYEIAGRRGWQVETAQIYYILMLSVQNSPQGIIIEKFSFWQKEKALHLADSIAQYLDVKFVFYAQK
ncbi:hypothetical protein [Hymenobacter sp. BT730]|uniref:hypothetical protein n=1 Tax=Hymenobacter sp. BT730 TaxID=3063332 RepID=UPI0026E0C94F|nr:hypothetical protein [Hymenobacter sp. BT730]